MIVNLVDEHFKDEGSFIKQDHSKIKNLMEHEIRILILEVVVEAKEKAMKNIQIGRIII